MNQYHRQNRYIYEGLITALAVGGVFIILGLIVVSTPGIVEKTDALFSDITWLSYPLGSSTVMVPAPANPAAHIELFTAVMSFILAVAILQIIILPVRLVLRSPIRRVAETLGNLIFWVGAAVVAKVLLLDGTVAGWFQFWSWLIVLSGVGLVARFFVLFATRSKRERW
jgi:hypothetical protein